MYEWPESSGWKPFQYALAVVAQMLVLLLVMVGILALGALAGAVLGIDMGPVR